MSPHVPLPQAVKSLHCVCPGVANAPGPHAVISALQAPSSQTKPSAQPSEGTPAAAQPPSANASSPSGHASSAPASRSAPLPPEPPSPPLPTLSGAGSGDSLHPTARSATAAHQMRMHQQYILKINGVATEPRAQSMVLQAPSRQIPPAWCRRTPDRSASRRCRRPGTGGARRIFVFNRNTLGGVRAVQALGTSSGAPSATTRRRRCVPTEHERCSAPS